MDAVWTRLDTVVTVDSRWVRLVAERWRDEGGQLLDYWRVERAASVIVATRRGDQLLLPRPQFRPGLGRATLDLPGGRQREGQSVLDSAYATIERELGLPGSAVLAARQLNQEGWPINSSFSNQLLFAVLADLDPAMEPTLPYEAVSAEAKGLRELLARLECLQCRAVVYELLALLEH